MHTPPPPQPQPQQRWHGVDQWRGVAVVWMTIYHFCFDLTHFGWLKANFYDDWFWILQRSCILSLFLMAAGFSWVLSVTQKRSWRDRIQRLILIGICAAGVSLSSWWMFPQSFIYFGVLHGMVIMLLILWMTWSWRRWFVWLGVGVWVVYALARPVHDMMPFLDILNSKPVSVLGFINRLPITEDYVPLLPWMAMIWWGAAWAIYGIHHPSNLTLFRYRTQNPLGKALAWLGRHSLVYYLVHQPVIMGVMLGIKAL